MRSRAGTGTRHVIVVDPRPRPSAPPPSASDTGCATKSNGCWPVSATAVGWTGAETSNATRENSRRARPAGDPTQEGVRRRRLRTLPRRQRRGNRPVAKNPVTGVKVGKRTAVARRGVVGGRGAAALALGGGFPSATRLMAVLTRRTCLPRSHVASLRNLCVSPQRRSSRGVSTMRTPRSARPADEDAGDSVLEQRRTAPECDRGLRWSIPPRSTCA